MHRRTFIATVAIAAAGLAVGVYASAPRRSGPRYLVRHPSGVWGLSERPEEEQGALVRHPSGILGIGPRGAGSQRLVMGEDGVIGVVPDDRWER